MAVIAPSEPGGHSLGSVPSPEVSVLVENACHRVTGIAEAWTETPFHVQARMVLVGNPFLTLAITFRHQKEILYSEEITEAIPLSQWALVIHRKTYRYLDTSSSNIYLRVFLKAIHALMKVYLSFPCPWRCVCLDPTSLTAFWGCFLLGKVSSIKIT